MVLNYIWIAFFLIAFVTALMRLVFLGDTQVFPEIINSTFNSSKTAFEISLGLTGVLSLWLGIMRIGEQGGVIALFSRLLGPLFSKLFPDIPKGHPVTGSIFMNLAANMLGLDNAATPPGAESDGGAARAEPQERYCQQPHDHVPGTEYIRAYTDSYQHHGISCTAGSNPTYRYICTHPAGNLLLHFGRHCSSKYLSENQSV